MSGGCYFCVRACADSHVWMCLTKKKHLVFKFLLLFSPFFFLLPSHGGDVTIKGTRLAVTSSKSFKKFGILKNSGVLLLVGHEKNCNVLHRSFVEHSGRECHSALCFPLPIQVHSTSQVFAQKLFKKFMKSLRLLWFLLIKSVSSFMKMLHPEPEQHMGER